MSQSSPQRVVVIKDPSAAGAVPERDDPNPRDGTSRDASQQPDITRRIDVASVQAAA